MILLKDSALFVRKKDLTLMVKNASNAPLISIIIKQHLIVKNAQVEETI